MLRLVAIVVLALTLTACGNPFHQKYGAWDSDVLTCTWVNDSVEMELTVTRKPHTDSAQEAKLFAIACSKIKPVLPGARH